MERVRRRYDAAAAYTAASFARRSIVLDRIPFVKTSIPGPIDYPIKTKQGLLFGGSLVNMMYNESWLGKLLAVVGIIRAS